MKIVTDCITIGEIRQMAQGFNGILVKAVVDLEQQIMAVDAQMHADEEALLLDQGSKQTKLWGINLYPQKYGTQDFIEFDSMINIRPSQDNLTRGVDNEQIRGQIMAMVNRLVVNETA